MGPEGAVNILCKRELDEAADRIVARAEKVAEFRAKFTNPFIAALRNLESKRDRNPPKKHGNIPL